MKIEGDKIIIYSEDGKKQLPLINCDIPEEAKREEACGGKPLEINDERVRNYDEERARNPDEQKERISDEEEDEPPVVVPKTLPPPRDWSKKKNQQLDGTPSREGDRKQLPSSNDDHTRILPGDSDEQSDPSGGSGGRGRIPSDYNDQVQIVPEDYDEQRNPSDDRKQQWGLGGDSSRTGPTRGDGRQETSSQDDSKQRVPSADGDRRGSSSRENDREGSPSWGSDCN